MIRTNRVLVDVKEFGRPNKTKKRTKRRTISKADIIRLVEMQHKKCANRDCARHHGVHQTITTVYNVDHIIPVKKWELLDMEGDPNDISNLQILCAGCHQRKTTQDKKELASLKKQIKRIKEKAQEEERKKNPIFW